ncbi:hypothetical protein [Amycolatopsis kentuckyensis]|uniref:hypothetical protein n=1 Tax=Amycolatopsis kentuckyensis TaxID=218823 RepID=UPI000A3A3315|nr:hypothetical protein [Amycolatopsis kentuckyensis]
MDHDEASGRHRRRRTNSVTRAALDEARRAGLVQRHLTKLRHLTARATAAPAAGDALPATSGAPQPETADRLPMAGRPHPVDHEGSSTSEAA